MPDADLTTPTFHINVWANPPSYLCLLCMAARDLTFDQVTAHLATVHDTIPVPHETLPSLLALRSQSDMRAAALAATESATSTLETSTVDTSPTEVSDKEPPHG